MRAAFVEELGPASNIRVGALAEPPVGAEDVLVRLDFAAVNHVDVLIRSGAFRTRVPMPLIIGRDLVGTVIAAGERAERYEPGQAVWCNSLGYDGRQGSFAELVAVPQERLYPLPPAVHPKAAVVVAHTAVTARLGLVREAGLLAGEAVLILGAGGGVGTAALQMAVQAGARAVAVDRADDEEWCRRCGAAAFVARTDCQLAVTLRDIAPAGFDVVWDCSGRYELDMLVPLAAQRGRIVVSAGFGTRQCLPVGGLYTRDARLLGFAISNASLEDLAGAADAVNEGLAAGWLEGRVRAVLPLDEARFAHEMQERRTPGAPAGRIVVVPSC